jgi:hypothetical protein
VGGNLLDPYKRGREDEAASCEVVSCLNSQLYEYSYVTYDRHSITYDRNLMKALCLPYLKMGTALALGLYVSPPTNLKGMDRPANSDKRLESQSDFLRKAET